MNNRFKQGTGCFTCTLCGKRTRQTGKHDYHMQDQCDECIDMCEHENAISDNEGSWPEDLMKKEVAAQQRMEAAFEERKKKYNKVNA